MGLPLMTGYRPASYRSAAAIMVALLSGLTVTGCDALNPGFIDVIAGDAGATFSTLDNAPGHVIITFINNAEIDERLIAYLETRGWGGDLTETEKQALGPRVRARARLTWTNGEQTDIEFVTGSPEVIEPRFEGLAVPDVSENDLDHLVVLCDVARVELFPASIEVFIPVEIDVYELVETDFSVFWRVRAQILPGFRPLQVDAVDQNMNVVVSRNIGLRNLPAPVDAPRCGTVITIVMDGTLSVPFLFGETPSYDSSDTYQLGAVGGRYEFLVSIQG